MSAELISQSGPEATLPWEELTREARLLYGDAFRTLNAIPAFQEALRKSKIKVFQAKPVRLYNKTVSFQHNDKTYEVRFGDAEIGYYGTKELTISDYESPSDVAPNSRLAIHFPSRGSQAKSYIVCTQLVVH
jgi:hypothetical protein